MAALQSRCRRLGNIEAPSLSEDSKLSTREDTRGDPLHQVAVKNARSRTPSWDAGTEHEHDGGLIQAMAGTKEIVEVEKKTYSQGREPPRNQDTKEPTRT